MQNYSNLKDVGEIGSGTYIEKGDLMVAKITPSFENGKQGIVRFEYDWGYATTEVIPIKGIENVSSVDYLYHYLKEPEVRNKLAGKMEGSTGRRRLSKTVLGECKIPFPSYDEQIEISAMLKTFYEKTLLLRKKIVLLDGLIKSTLRQMLSGNIRVKDVNSQQQPKTVTV